MAGIPHCSHELSTLSNKEELDAGIRTVCRALLQPDWDGIADEAIEISTITGGISNALYKATPAPSHGVPPVLCRVYGLNTDRFIDREREVAVMQLVKEYGFGTKVLGTFGTGRLEAFLPQKCLEPDQLKDPKVAAAIGRTMYRFHAVPGPGPKSAATPFGRIHGWLDMAEKFTWEDPKKREAFSEFDLKDLRRQVMEVEELCAAVQSPIVFGHNDLLAGNVMVSEAFWEQTGPDDALQRKDGTVSSADSDITFIDFEYVDWTPRGFDWGNHFNEYAGFDGNYDNYPTPAEASMFLRSYLAAERGCPEEEVPEEDVERAVVEADLFALASHQYWGAWCFLQAQWSKLDFDYLEYARVRWGESARRQNQVLEAARKLFT